MCHNEESMTMIKNSYKLLILAGLLPIVFACSDRDDRVDPGGGKSDEVATLSAERRAGEQIVLHVYKSPTCGCCGKWVDHMADRGFALTTHHPTDMYHLKQDKGIAQDYQSCHTAVSAEGYVFEGHIPARYIQQFLHKPPAGARGLVVPAMPVGSPGMEVEDRFMPYDVLLLKEDGSMEVFVIVTSAEQQY